jgi:hypothetical protein
LRFLLWAELVVPEDALLQLLGKEEHVIPIQERKSQILRML